MLYLAEKNIAIKAMHLDLQVQAPQSVSVTFCSQGI